MGRSKRKKIINRILFLVVFIAAGITLFLKNDYSFFRNMSYKKFKEFGIRLPIKYKVNGIDVSHHQGKINWKLVKEMKVKDVNIVFSFIKATEGKHHKDRMFTYNWKQTKKNKIIRGAYHYFSPNISGDVQAKNFIRTVKLIKGDLPPVIDVEDIGRISSSKLINEIKEYITIIEKHYRVEPILYTYHDFYKLHLKGKFDNYPLWIAHYHVNKPNNKMWNLWQHSDRGRVSGINAKVDFNVFNRDINAFNKLLIK